MIEIPEGIEVVRWCSMFCTGNRATGDLYIEDAGTYTAVPICDECKGHIESNTGESLDTSPDGVVE